MIYCATTCQTGIDFFHVSFNLFLSVIFKNISIHSIIDKFETEE